MLPFLPCSSSSRSLASRKAMTASVSLRRVAVSTLPTESLRSRPPPLPLLMRGMSSAGTLPLGFSMVKLPCLTRGFPAFSPPPPPPPSAPPFLSSDLFLRSEPPDILSGALDGEEAELGCRLPVISLREAGGGRSSSALLSFSWGSVSCFSPISDPCPAALAWLVARVSSAGGWGSVLRLRSVRLEEDSPLLREAPDPKASPRQGEGKNSPTGKVGPAPLFFSTAGGSRYLSLCAGSWPSLPPSPPGRSGCGWRRCRPTGRPSRGLREKPGWPGPGGRKPGREDPAQRPFSPERREKRQRVSDERLDQQNTPSRVRYI